MELPEIQKLVDALRKDAKKDVLIVALSQDNEPQEISRGPQARREDAGRQEDRPRRPARSAGSRLDPSNSVGKAFEVEGFPTLVILDGKGIVQSAHVGYNPDAAEPLHKSLTTEIETLLEGKSLVVDKDRAAKEAKKQRGK